MTGDRSFYSRVTVVALLFIAGVSVVPVIVQGMEGAEGFYFGFIPVVVGLVFAGLMWRYGGRWLLAAPILGVVTWLIYSIVLSYDSDALETFFDFAPAIVALVAGLVVFVSGPMAYLQGRKPSPRATAVDRAVFGALAVVVLALVVSSGIVSSVGRDSVSAAERAAAFGLVEMKGTEFRPLELEIPADQPVSLVVENNDLIVHTFTLHPR